MKWYCLDMIIRNVLLRCGYSMHWYMDALVYAKDILRQLALDDARYVSARKIAVTQPGNYVNLPCNCVDVTKVGLEVGQLIKPLAQRDGINNLHAYDSAGAITDYTQLPSATSAEGFFTYGWPSNLVWGMVDFNEYGETTGRFYGIGSGSEWDSYKLLPERGQIQLSESIVTDYLYIEFIDDGLGCDAATKVDPYAQDVIEAYILWQFRLHNRTAGASEVVMRKTEYDSQRQIYRARLDPLTYNDIKRILQRAYYAAPKV